MPSSGFGRNFGRGRGTTHRSEHSDVHSNRNRRTTVDEAGECAYPRGTNLRSHDDPRRDAIRGTSDVNPYKHTYSRAATTNCHSHTSPNGHTITASVR
jgi:hypothetical protein